MKNTENNENTSQSSDQLSCIINHNAIDGIIVNPSCKLCKSIHRKEAEKIAEDARGNINYATIKVFLDGKGESIALANIKNHIQKHFLGQSDKIALEEYRHNLIELSKHRTKRFESVEQLVDIATLEMSRCFVMQTNGISEEKDRMKMIHDNMRIIMECYSSLEGMEDADRKVQVLFERVTQAFRDTKEKTRDDQKAQEIMDQVIAVFNRSYGLLDGKTGA